MEQLDLFGKDDFANSTQTYRKENDFAKNYQTIVLTSSVKQDQYTNFVGEKFDLHISDTSEVIIPNKINLNTLNDWNIGVICGASGSGKSTILRHLAKQSNTEISNPSFDNSKCLISNFTHMTPNDVTILLSAMGLASVPTWIRPFNVLSNGEQYRASLAMLVSKAKEGEIIFVDEYTSVVDRNVAKAMSNALQKYIRKNKKKIILATCHYDIFEWLRPDWIYDLNKGGVLEKGDYLRQYRPPIELQVYRTTIDTWERFKKYHYMTAQLNESATCFVFTWGDKLVAFMATLPLPSGTIKKGIRGSRTVVLPDFQGLGIGTKITDFLAAIYTQQGYSYYHKTINPALGIYLEKSPKWKSTPRNNKEMLQRDISCNMMGGLQRPSYCHKYVGEPISGYENLLLPIDKIKYINSMKGQLLLFD